MLEEMWWISLVEYWARQPTKVHAVQVSWSTWSDLCALVEDHKIAGSISEGTNDLGETPTILVEIETEDYDYRALTGDWVVRDESGKLSVWVNEEFQRCYEKREAQEILEDENVDIGLRWVKRIQEEIDELQQSYEVRSVRVSQAIWIKIKPYLLPGLRMPFPYQSISVTVGISESFMFGENFIELDYYSHNRGTKMGTRGIIV